MKAKARLERDQTHWWILCDDCPDPDYCFQEVEAVDEDGEHLSSGYPCYMMPCTTAPECEHLKARETDEQGALWITCDSDTEAPQKGQ